MEAVFVIAYGKTRWCFLRLSNKPRLKPLHKCIKIHAAAGDSYDDIVDPLVLVQMYAIAAACYHQERHYKSSSLVSIDKAMVFLPAQGEVRLICGE